MLGIYLHWPFCLGRCAYCDFVSGTDRTIAGPYARALLTEIETAARLFPEPVDTVFFGGGTPSLCPPDTLTAIFDALHAHFRVAEGAEITVEMNPRTVQDDWLAAARRAGINRVSIGLQAAQDAHLAQLGRLHTAAEAADACRSVRQAGIGNISVDLMYGLPGQTMAEWLQSLEFACGLHPEHLSCYALNVEEGTRLAARIAAGLLPSPDDDLAADMYVAAQNFLEAAGYAQYEVSNFALPGRTCRHNIRYWTLADYLGLGAAAHSMTGGLRFANTRDVRAYITAQRSSLPAVSSLEFADAAEKQREYFMLTSRLTAGFSAADFETRFAIPFKEEDRQGLAQALAEGLLHRRGGRLAPTALGLRFQNRLAGLLMTDV